MAINESNVERDRFIAGDAAGDKKGDMLRIHTLKAEHTAKILFSWLSGGKSEVRLPQALSIARGGTGGTTAQSARLSLGMFVDTNDEVVFGPRAISLYDGVILDHTNAIDPGYTKVATGHYEVSKVPGFGLFGFKYRLPKDDLGNLLCGCDITFNSDVATVKVYEITYTNGKAELDLTKPMDIPAQRCIDISVK